MIPSLAVLYEHPRWFEPLFAALGRRGIEPVRVDARSLMFDPASADVPAPIVFNRVAMSAPQRDSDGCGLDVGGIEYLIDDRDGTPASTTSTLVQFRRDPLNVLGWDPHERLVDYLEQAIAEKDGGEVRLLDAGVRRLAAQRRGRGDGGELGLCPPPDPAQRGDRLGPDPDRRAQPQRHQGRRGAGARRLVDRRGACRGDLGSS
jgi:hypothetical protein